ncbi:MAG: ribonucleoside-triphosphate reductase [Candidatus Taylorbacteria bacterium RIFCSPLOWO2_12_FULL_47_20]|uniref:Ribonucleoside-triphosphate reductase n=1 Tax=Candidatus Taylorbacteria bacterium RIFCSPLOWO2_12_FULL_47_20 TaxID=1802335 RepID=A0A1G2P8V4_9BACT|nr:MAG: ribonucleoside-triphosphate reductase [Candidatus Taylorbacteria bacterium RIFCSPLOWO2_12_FULL_47_20]
MVKKVQKRDGSIVPFDLSRIITATWKAMIQTGEGSQKEAELVANKVFAELLRITKKHKNFIPTVEGIQDTVEKELILSDYVKTSKAYILYREKRAKLREKGLQVPEKVRKLATDSKQYFRNSLGEFVYYRTYSRWIDEEGRRETWIETVGRYVAYMKGKLGKKLKESEYQQIREGILRHEAMPSMRLLQFAGKAADTTNVCAYNCSYIAPESFRDIAEIMYVSMCGTGAGWSVESQNVQRLPQIQFQSGVKLSAHIIEDSKEGWCDAFIKGMETWASGKDIEFDYSLIRPAGARLKTMGGKASGPAPLQRLLNFTREKMFKKQGKRLSNLDVHDIICMVGDCVVAGGVRRSAMISLSDFDDQEIRDAKKGQFYLNEPQRTLANNSAVYLQKPTNEEFLEEWMALIKSRSGERGIFNRGSLVKTLPKRRLDEFTKAGLMEPGSGMITGLVGTNPCGEILLQSKQFCNLSEVVARAEDTEETLVQKIRLATILGTFQSTLTNFPYLSKQWKENCERERLLGVSITGQWDCPLVRKPEVLEKLRKETIRINQVYAKKFGINASTCITCVKPSGTLSQMVDCSSGMHPRHSQYYIRRIRIAATDTLFKMLKDQGVPFHPEVGQSADNATTYVLEFPVKAPTGGVFRDDVSALEQLEYWKIVKTKYTEHNPSTTISVGDDEWLAVADWLYKNWDIVGGLSFLPRDNHVYQLAPYETIDEKTYHELAKRLSHIDYSKIITYEKQNETDLKKELACVAGVCEIV